MDAFENTLRLAFEAHNRGQPAEAEALCRQLLPEQRPDSRLYFLLGMALHQLGRDTEALDPLLRAAELAPADAGVFNGLGCVYHRLKDHTRAALYFQQAIVLKPQSADLYYSLGNALFPLGNVEAAANAFHRSVELNPKDAQSWNNLGKTLKELNRLDESLAGRTLFLHAEQGFGDAIQTVRYLPQLRQSAARVILECRPELKPLFTYNNCADTVIAYGEPIPPFDSFTSFITVAGSLGITLETIPNRVPYISAPSAEKLPGANPKIGLVWAGNPGHNDDALRSVPLASLLPVLQVPGKDFYSLQVPVPDRDREVLATVPNLMNQGARFNDFLDTATVVAQLDLVIAVDTAVAHLAGALGKPVWVLVQHSPDWRWFRRCGDTTPWYPTMRLFRQTERGQWTPVIARVAEALRGAFP